MYTDDPFSGAKRFPAANPPHGPAHVAVYYNMYLCAIISDLLYQNLFKPDQLAKSSNVASARVAPRPSSVDSVPGPMAKHAINKSAPLTEDEITKTRAVVADVSSSNLKSTVNEKRAEKCKEKCPANIKDCCRNAIAGNVVFRAPQCTDTEFSYLQIAFYSDLIL